MSSGCPFAHDDGAYVLGALSPAERAAYERHLTGCAACQSAVAEIAVLPGLLGRLDRSGLERADRSRATEARLPELIEAAAAARRRERRAHRWRYAATALVAACLVLLGGSAATLQSADPAPPSGPPPAMTAMRPIREGVPVRAEIRLRGAGWGTEISMRCAYEPRPDYAKPYAFHLVAYGRDGAHEQVASWLAAPGDQVELTGATRFPVTDLARVELTRYDGTPLLAYELP